jgi:hypothetical protein
LEVQEYLAKETGEERLRKMFSKEWVLIAVQMQNFELFKSKQ